MRPVPSSSARRRRAIVVLAVAAALTAIATAVGATRRGPPPQLLNYQAYVGGKGKAKANLSPVTIGYINGQGGPPNFNFPQATSVIRAGVKMVNAELGGIHGHPLRLSECFWAQAEEEGVRCGQQMVNNNGEGDHLRVRHGRQPVDLRDGQGHDPDRRRRHGQPGRPDGEERLLPERQPDERARAVRHVHEAIPTEGEDRRHRLSERPGRDHGRGRLAEGLGAGRREGDDDRGAAAGDRPDRRRRRRRARPT